MAPRVGGRRVQTESKVLPEEAEEAAAFLGVGWVEKHDLGVPIGIAARAHTSAGVCERGTHSEV